MIMTARTFVYDTCSLGEGPFWFEDRLWWVDIDGGVLHSVNGLGQDRRSYELGQKIGAAVPLEAGGFIVALEEGIGVFDPASGRVDILHAPERGVEGSRFNDGKCDPAGRFLAGTFCVNEGKKTSSLYSLSTEGSLEKLYSPVTISNGLAWSADGRTMYYIDTPTFEIAAFAYDTTTGRIGSRSAVVKIPKTMGYPDGMCIDTIGNLWVAHWGGSAVRCWSPVTGECLAEIRVPCLQPTSCCFGGPDFSHLYITTARKGDDVEVHPLAGSVFICQPGAVGFPVRSCSLRKRTPSVV
jgi:sugar lactone lactonase YvrE